MVQVNDNTPFRLCGAMISAMGGAQSSNYRRFKELCVSGPGPRCCRPDYEKRAARAG